MTRILFVIPTLDRSGAERQLTLLATRLPRKEFDVRVVTLTRGGPYERVLREAGVPVTVLHKRWKLDPGALRQLNCILRDWQPDLVHSWLFAANAYVRLLTGKAPKPKVLVSERCVDTWKSDWQRWLDRRQISRTARLVGNSQAVGEFYRRLGVPQDKVVVIPNGVEVADGRPVDRDAKLQELAIPSGARVVGYVGRLARQKRLDDLVWAMQLLKQVTGDVYFLVVGDGPEAYRLRRFAQKLGCDDLVRFAGHRDDACELIPLLSVFWLGSDFEGMSNSLMEAMAAGVPVVASDIPPNRELVVDGETGYLVKVGDSVAFARRSSQILDDPDLARRLGDAGRQRMGRRFSVDTMVERHAALYREVLGG